MRIQNSTADHLVVYIAPKKNNYTLVGANAALGAGLEGGDASVDLKWVSDQRDESTQRRRIEKGKIELVPLQTRDGAYITVCRSQKVGSNLCDVVVGDVNCFLRCHSLLTLTE